MVEVNYVYRNSQVVGSTVYDPATGRGMSTASSSPDVSGFISTQNYCGEASVVETAAVAEPSPSAWVQAGQVALAVLLFPFVIFTGCDGSTGDQKGDFPEDAGTMGQPDTDTITDLDTEIPGTQTDAGTILPGDGELPADVFETIEGQGTAFFSQVKLYPFSTEFELPGIHSTPLHIEVGVDSSIIEELPAAACLPGLIDDNQATPADIENGYSCPEDGYQTFAVCPTDNSKRLPVYIGSYTVTVSRFVGGEYEEVGTVTGAPNTLDNLYANEGTELVPFCGASPTPFIIDIPPALMAEAGDSAKVSIQADLYIDGRQADENGHYLTQLRFKVND
jgi:hypothetical protein